MGTILLATDGSEHARRAAERAIELASDRGATLHVLCVVDRRVHGEPGLGTEELSTIAAEDHGHDCVAEVGRMASDRAISVEGDVRHGVPQDLILEYAEEIDAGAIVIGEHGDHTEHLGGVGRTIEAESPREVVVVALEG